MDLSPFSAIDPCGYRGLEVTQTKDLDIALPPAQVAEKLLQYLTNQLNY
jgi:lipoyl(octanoyl) transferase